jgi:hypothetical protein
MSPSTAGKTGAYYGNVYKMLWKSVTISSYRNKDSNFCLISIYILNLTAHQDKAKTVQFSQLKNLLADSEVRDAQSSVVIKSLLIALFVGTVLTFLSLHSLLMHHITYQENQSQLSRFELQYLQS